MSVTDPVRPVSAPTPQIVPPAPEAPAPVDDAGRAVKQTLIWATGENEWASRGRLINGNLNGVSRFAFGLDSDNISVTGQTSYRTGRRPDTEHPPATANHDNFDQGMLYVGLRDIEEQYTSVTGKSFAALVRAKGHQTQARGHANSFTDLNAYYSPSSEELHFGTSSGKWDLASDKDVVKHEMGHFVLDHLAPGVEGALHEGYGDAQSALSQGDPELSEDFGRIVARPGQWLRTSNNTKTVANTDDEVHERGEVYAGLLWEIGEHLHVQATGRARDRAVDAQPLDRRAADNALRILWTFPLFLGTNLPDGPAVVRSLHRAVDSLAAAGKLRGVRIADLQAFIDAEAARRGLNVAEPPPTGQDPGKPVILHATERQAALDEAISLAGLDPSTTTLEPVWELSGPMNERIERFRVRVNLGGGAGDQARGDVLRPHVAGELLTLTTSQQGTIEAQVGRLPESSSSIARQKSRAIDPEVLLEAQVALVDRAVADLKGISSGTVPPGPRTAANDAHLARVALQQLMSDGAPTPQAVWWRDGALGLELRTSTLVFEGKLNPDGSLAGVRRVSGVICGPEGFVARP